ncbi:hypothetical protein T484DRAFT_1961431 [Baffinella frigidus]|nr:hypothetical protein T484DRAFT_1961431 [Cryptophyta sp. CCMP2293]
MSCLLEAGAALRRGGVRGCRSRLHPPARNSRSASVPPEGRRGVRSRGTSPPVSRACLLFLNSDGPPRWVSPPTLDARRRVLERRLALTAAPSRWPQGVGCRTRRLPGARLALPIAGLRTAACLIPAPCRERPSPAQCPRHAPKGRGTSAPSPAQLAAREPPGSQERGSPEPAPPLAPPGRGWSGCGDPRTPAPAPRVPAALIPRATGSEKTRFLVRPASPPAGGGRRDASPVAPLPARALTTFALCRKVWVRAPSPAGESVLRRTEMTTQ